jgi:hypothetical protein
MSNNGTLSIDDQLWQAADNNDVRAVIDLLKSGANVDHVKYIY